MMWLRIPYPRYLFKVDFPTHLTVLSHRILEENSSMLDSVQAVVTFLYPLSHKAYMKREALFKKAVINLRKEGAKKIVVFGSYARNEQKPKSDLDLIVKFSRSIGLMDLVRIEQNLSDDLNVKVDLLTEKAISPLIRQRIKEDEMVLFG